MVTRSSVTSFYRFHQTIPTILYFTLLSNGNQVRETSGYYEGESRMQSRVKKDEWGGILSSAQVVVVVQMPVIRTETAKREKGVVGFLPNEDIVTSLLDDSLRDIQTGRKIERQPKEV